MRICKKRPCRRLLGIRLQISDVLCKFASMTRISALILTLLIFCACGKENDESATIPIETKEYIVVGYATYWDTVMPDPTLLTHINYAFAKIQSDFESLEIRTPSRLEKIVALKQTNPDLKVLLAIGGWGAGNFSELVENPMKVAPSLRRENAPRFRSGKISFRSSFGALVSDTMRV